MSADGIEPLACGGHRLRADQHEGDHAGLAAGINPVVDGATLHQHVAGLELDYYAVVEVHFDLASDHDRVVYRIGTVVARGDARSVAHDAEHRAALDRGLERAVGRVVETVIVDRKACGRPHHAGRRAGPVGDDILGDLVDFHLGVTVGGVPGYDAANLQAHRSFLSYLIPQRLRNAAKICARRGSASRHSLRSHSFSRLSSGRLSTTSSCSSLFGIRRAASPAVAGVWITSLPAMMQTGALIELRSASVAPTIGSVADSKKRSRHVVITLMNSLGLQASSRSRLEGRALMHSLKSSLLHTACMPPVRASLMNWPE